MIHGRLDYCNSVLYGMSSVNLNTFQRVQNSAARIFTWTKRSEHITSILAELFMVSGQVSNRVQDCGHHLQSSHQQGAELSGWHHQALC